MVARIVVAALALAVGAEAAAPSKPSIVARRGAAANREEIGPFTGSPVVQHKFAPKAIAPKRRGFLSAATLGGVDVSLILYFVFWYVGNAIYNMYNTMALKAVGGKHSGLTMTVSTMQLGICTLYAGLLWLSNFNPVTLLGLEAPTKMPKPQTTKDDIIATVPVGFCAAAAHSAGVFCLGADPLFGQIVKAGEPVLSAFVNTVFYGKAPSLPKVVCLFFIVAGVGFASLKKNLETGAYALKFDERALIFGLIGNCFAAFKGSENKKLMTLEGVKDRMGGVANQFALTEVLGFFISLPVMFATEYKKFGHFLSLLTTSKELQVGLLLSGMSFYLYNELATMTIKKTGAVTASVANTAKRVIVLVFMSAVTGKALTSEQKIGAAIAISFVLLYSVIDDLVKKFSEKSA
jgi:solute carrier family 35 protein E1